MKTLRAEDVIKEVRKEFEARLERKTGWGKNEVMQEFDQAISVAILKLCGVPVEVQSQGSARVPESGV